MGFYDNSKEERERITFEISDLVREDYEKGQIENIIKYSSDSDTYIRKIVYLAIGRLYNKEELLREAILNSIDVLLLNSDEKVRQTAVYSLGEIGKVDGEKALTLLEKALFDKHHSVVNAVIGALKQMGEKNPKPTLEFAGKYSKHEDPKVRREMIHGIELRGRTHPQEVLPILAQAQNDCSKKIREMVIHVLGQISYKKGCLEIVLEEISEWENKELVKEAINEILDVHIRYEKFSAKSHEEAKWVIENHIKLQA